MALGSALSRRPISVRIGPTDTHPRNASPRLLPLPEATGADARAIILAAPPPEANRPARRPSADLGHIDDGREGNRLPNRPSSHLRRNSRPNDATDHQSSAPFLQNPMRDSSSRRHPLSRVRRWCTGSRASSSTTRSSTFFRRMLTCARANAFKRHGKRTSTGREVSLRASILPEDMQGDVPAQLPPTRLRRNAPCPSDTAIARAYGTHSLRRALETLAYIEEQGLAVCQLDGMGRRIVTLVEPAWATAPGNPDADEMAGETCDLQ